jgi:adenosylhomocysteine nucleosidase
VITGIVVALPEELSTLTTKRCEKGRVEHISEKILVVCSGVGAENAGVSAELLVGHGVNSLISWGCAAALDKACQPGDLVLTGTCVDADQLEVKPADQAWIELVLGKLLQALAVPIHIGKMAESKSIVGLSLDKAEIAKATGAVALDMESAAVAKVAKLHGLPFLVVRAIADPLNMDLPKAVSHALSDEGEVVLSKLLLFLLRHPNDAPGLLKLGLHFNAARSTLKRVAKQLAVLATIHLSTQ